MAWLQIQELMDIALVLLKTVKGLQRSVNGIQIITASKYLEKEHKMILFQITRKYFLKDLLRLGAFKSKSFFDTKKTRKIL